VGSAHTQARRLHYAASRPTAAAPALRFVAASHPLGSAIPRSSPRLSARCFGPEKPRPSPLRKAIKCAMDSASKPAPVESIVTRQSRPQPLRGGFASLDSRKPFLSKRAGYEIHVPLFRLSSVHQARSPVASRRHQRPAHPPPLLLIGLSAPAHRPRLAARRSAPRQTTTNCDRRTEQK